MFLIKIEPGDGGVDGAWDWISAIVETVVEVLKRNGEFKEVSDPKSSPGIENNGILDNPG